MGYGGSRAPEHHTGGMIVPMVVRHVRIGPGRRTMRVEVLVGMKPQEPDVETNVEEGRSRPEQGGPGSGLSPSIQDTGDHRRGTLTRPKLGQGSWEESATGLPQSPTESRRWRTASMKASCFFFIAAWESAIFPWRPSAALCSVRRDS